MNRIEQSDDFVDLGSITEATHGAVGQHLDTIGLQLQPNGIADD
jgi:hypothetical protein